MSGHSVILEIFEPIEIAILGMNTRDSQKVKVLIVGGGGSALAAAWRLSEPDMEGRFDVTIHQMGWRLGGKGASSRLVDDHGIIIEHGLHILGGFYHATFAMLDPLYKEWQTISGSLPIKFEDAFKPQSRFHLAEKVGGKWVQILIDTPTNDRPLGKEPTKLGPGAMLRVLVEWLVERFAAPKIVALTDEADSSHQNEKMNVDAHLSGWINDDEGQTILTSIKEIESDPVFSEARDSEILKTIEARLQNLGEAQNTVFGTSPTKSLFWNEVSPDPFFMMRLAWVIVKGLIADRMYITGFDPLNKEELKVWLRRHGASQAMLDCCYTRSGYDYLFAYVDGDPTKGDIAAGVGLRGLLRLLFTYHKSVFIHMNGSMGEIVFTPLYEVLKARGVKFEFFSQLAGVEINQDTKMPSKLTFTRQAKIKTAPYEPLMQYSPAGGLWPRKIWPHGPLVAQLENQPPIEGSEAEMMFEAADSSSRDTYSLEATQDFDVVVLAIPPHSIRALSGNLLAASKPLANAVSKSTSCATLGGQFWLAQKTGQLRGPTKATVLTTYAQPFATWADMSYLLSWTDWTHPTYKHSSYVCGAEVISFQTEPADIRSVKRQLEVKAAAIATSWWNANAKTIMPNAPNLLPIGNPSGIRYYARVNALPSERYVQSRAGTIEARIKTDGSGIANLYVAGDWIKNGWDCGAFEPAIVSGLQAARAISGANFDIPGEQDF
jgi:uncharacterized protein with NAD-binding domain and iron-sulfur cluster